MRVAFITRSTLFTVRGGDTVQVEQTAQQLTKMDVKAEIILANQAIDYQNYDLLHFFNIGRPADILFHSKQAKKPFVVSTILCNYSGYDKHHRKGAGSLLKYLTDDGIEYVKTMARWVLRKDELPSLDYTWKGQKKSIIEILRHAAVILPNSESEYRRVQLNYPAKVKYMVVPNGVNGLIFKHNPQIKKEELMVLCVARIEGIKNQLNLIKALNNTRYQLYIIGAHAPNQGRYYQQCRETAAGNVTFINHISHQQLVLFYERAKVHILPSWFETTGLSSVEAAAMGCNIVITDRGDTREYFGDDAFYCDPSKPDSMLAAVDSASLLPVNTLLRKKVLKQYTWREAALQTLKAYQIAIA